MCGCQFTSLKPRREAACFGLLCRLLDVNCVEPLQDTFVDLQLEFDSRDFLMHPDPLVQTSRRSSSAINVTDLRDTYRDKSVENFKRAFVVRAHDIFDGIPDSLKQQGLKDGWLSIMDLGQEYILNNYNFPERSKNKKKKRTRKTKHSHTNSNNQNTTPCANRK